MTVRLSIIIPVYNTEKFLRKCIDSVLLQKYDEFEIILINDGSTDGSLLICQEYSTVFDNITLIDKKNEGVMRARLCGLSIARGEYISFLDSDDYVHDDYYYNLMNELKSNSADMVVSSHYCIRETVLTRGLYNSTECLTYLCLLQYPTSVWAGIYPREILLKLDYYVNIHFFEDFLFHFILLHSIDSVFVLDEDGYCYHSNEYSINKQLINEKRMSCLKIIPMISREGKLYDSKLEKYIWFSAAHFLISNITASSNDKDRKQLMLDLKKNCKKYCSAIQRSDIVPLKYKIAIALMSNNSVLATNVAILRRKIKSILG